VYLPDLSRNNTEKDQYYWKPSNRNDRKPTTKPALALRFNLLENLSPGGCGFAEYNTAHYSQLRKGEQSARFSNSSDNPFGRFNDRLSKYAYIPLPVPYDDIVTNQTKIDSSGPLPRLPITGLIGKEVRKRLGQPDVDLPAVVEVEGGEKFHLVSIDAFGATYGSELETKPLKQRTQGPPKPRYATKPTTTKLAQLRKQPPSGGAQTATVDKARIGAFQGTRAEDIAQSAVMFGLTAGQVARAAGLTADDQDYRDDHSQGDVTSASKHGFQWLHLIAYHFGGTTVGPQHSENLVVGSTAANTWMIMIENAVADLVASGHVATADIKVTPAWHDKRLRVAKTIKYEVTLNRIGQPPVQHTEYFDALTSITPHTVTHRQYKRQFRELMGLPAEKSFHPGVAAPSRGGRAKKKVG
jgi:hypothetical protein